MNWETRGDFGGGIARDNRFPLTLQNHAIEIRASPLQNQISVPPWPPEPPCQRRRQTAALCVSVLKRLWLADGVERVGAAE